MPLRKCWEHSGEASEQLVKLLEQPSELTSQANGAVPQGEDAKVAEGAPHAFLWIWKYEMRHIFITLYIINGLMSTLGGMHIIVVASQMKVLSI